MKYLIYLSVLLFAFQIAFTQNYQCIKDDATYYYSNNSFFKAISIDSVVDAGDSLVYYNYPNMTDDPENYWCYNRFGPSWIGRYVTVRLNGENIFYNKYEQPITIQTLKVTGENWTCFTFDNGNYMLATIAEILEMEFLGLTDTVKKITLQAYSPNGDSIAYPLNDKYLLLSKNYGLIRAISFKYFPNHSGGLITPEYCSEYTLSGISEQVIGIQNLTAAMVFDFDVGDELHTERTINGNVGYYKTYFYKRFYLQKMFSPNLDTVSYTIYRCGYSVELIPYQGYVYDYYKDTLLASYFIGEDTAINELPDKVIIFKEDPGYWEYSITNCEYFGATGRLMKTKSDEGFYSIYPHDCIEYYESKDLGNHEKYYIEGLGSYFINSDYNMSEWNEPVYYKKGEEEWGTPHDINCDSIFTEIDKQSIIENLVTIAPNPMKEWATISLESAIDSEYSLMLYNSTGKPVKEYNFFGSEYRIKRNGMPDGIYFYVLENSNGFKNSGKLILQ